MGNKEAIKKLENIPEINLNNVSENGPYELKPTEFALIKDRSFYTSIEGKKLELVGIVGKVTTKENLKCFKGNKPFILASNKFKDNGTIELSPVSHKKYFSEIFEYFPISKVVEADYLSIKE